MANSTLPHPRLLPRPATQAFDDEVTAPQTPRARTNRPADYDSARQHFTASGTVDLPLPAPDPTDVILVGRLARLRISVWLAVRRVLRFFRNLVGPTAH